MFARLCLVPLAMCVCQLARVIYTSVTGTHLIWSLVFYDAFWDFFGSENFRILRLTQSL